MSLGLSATAWVAIGSAVATVGSAVYTSDKQRKLQHEAQDAADQAKADDARQRAELDTSAALAANAKFAADKRARQANVLALGGVSSPLGGAPAGGQVVGAVGGLGGGQSTTSGSSGAGSVLGSGAPPGGGYVPRPGGGSVLAGGSGGLVTVGGGSNSGTARRGY